MARFRAQPADDDLGGGARSASERQLDDLRSIADDVIGDATEPMGVYAFRPEEPGAALARHVEQTVFEEAIGDTAAAVIADEFVPYDHASLLFCVIDQHRRLPAAMLRLILPSRVGLKSLNDIAPTWGMSTKELFEAG